VVDEFYRRYDAMAEASSDDGVARFVDRLTEDFQLEDPTAGLRYTSRADLSAALTKVRAAGDFSTIHWEIDRRITDGSWVAVEGTFRGVYRQRPFAARFTTWLRLRGDRVAQQIDYVDYVTFRKMTSPPAGGAGR
jgi:hypothetical protein